MGHRFVTTEECDADPAFKQSYLDATQQDIEIIKSPVGSAGAGHPQLVPRPGEGGVETPQELPVRLHQDVRRDAQPLLHHARRSTTPSREIAERLCLLRRNAWRAERSSPVRDLMASLQGRVRQFSLKGKLFGVK